MGLEKGSEGMINEIKKCAGCGASMQTIDPQAAGYVLNDTQNLCRRCYRLKHYGDQSVLKVSTADSDEVLSRVAKMDVLVVYVLDLCDVEGGLLPGLHRHLMHKDVLLIATKRDLLPDTFANDKLLGFLKSRMRELGISVKGVVVTGNHAKESAGMVAEAIHALRKGKDVVVVGMANAGKSTLLNALIPEAALTVSPYPHTTLDFNPIPWQNITLYDTPGIKVEDSLWEHLAPEAIKLIGLKSAYKPKTFQLSSSQSFVLGGLGALTIVGAIDAKATFYVSENLAVHRTKGENLQEYLIKHFDELAPRTITNPRFTKHFSHRYLPQKTDVVFGQIGWVAIQGNYTQIDVEVPSGVDVHFRKAMI
jgi:ribosome biogenesis GTPase YqeH